MPLHVVDAQEWLVEAPGERLGEAEPDDQRPDQPGATGGGDGIDLRLVDTGLAQGIVDQGADGLDVGACRHLGHHAAESGMALDLAGDHR